MSAFAIFRSNLSPKASSAGQVSRGLLAGVGAVLVLLVAGGWIYYHFVVGLRLPQERSLTIQGNPLQVRVESCNDIVVKYTLLADGTTHYAAIAKLSDADQNLFRQLPKTLVLEYPFEMPLEQGGAALPVRIDGHNDDWVKYTILADHSTHFLPLTSLSASDQVVVKQLPTIIECEFPLTHVMTNQQGQSLPAMIAGRTNDLVKFKTDDGMNLFLPLNQLSPLDQKLMQLFAPNSVFGTHTECLLTDKAGNQLNVRLDGRSANIVQYTLLSDGLDYYLPIEDLAANDQQLVRLLSARMNFSFPLDYNITDAQGKPARVRLDGRTENIVKYTLLADGREYYLPLNSFTPADQKFLQMLPTNLAIEFPLSYVLTVQSGESLDARILGRNADSVNFQLADGKTYNYPLAKLSPASREFLLLLPANEADKSMQAETPLPKVAPAIVPPPLAVAANIPPPEPVANGALVGLRAQLHDMVQASEQMQNGIDNLHVSNRMSANDGPNPRDMALVRLEDNNTQIEDICKEINANLPKNPKDRGSALVQGWWSSVLQTIQRDDQIRQDISNAGASERQGLESELRDSQKSLITLLGKINSQTRQYSP